MRRRARFAGAPRGAAGPPPGGIRRQSARPRPRDRRIALLVALAGYAFWRLEFSFARLGSGMGQLAHMLSLMWPPTPGNKLPIFLNAMAETLAIALLGTLTAAVLAFPVGFLAAKNVVPNIFAHFAVRRFLDTIRGVDVLIWALIFINVVGLGPFAGILALAVSDFGTFGKLFSEAIETADKRPSEGVLSTGGSQLHTIRFALMPQVFPVIASQVLYYFEFEHAIGDDYRYRRGGRHRHASHRADPHPGMGHGGVPGAAHPRHRRLHRLDFGAAAACGDRTVAGRDLITFRPRTRFVRRRTGRAR